jgi:hypothetical protein
MTFLFTDIEGSTHRWEPNPEEMRVALDAHDAVMQTLDFIEMSIRNYLDAGNYFLLPQPMAVLAHHLDRIEYYEVAATLSGFATTSFATSYFPETEIAIAHLREVLGEETYASLAGGGAAMTNAEMAKYALEQIDLVRAHLVHADESP